MAIEVPDTRGMGEPAESVFKRPPPRRKRPATKPAATPAAQPAEPPTPAEQSHDPVPEPMVEPPAAVAPAPAPEPVPEPVPQPAADEPESPRLLPSVVVRLGGSRYALEMDAVAEVGRLPGITRVPGVPSWVAGVANWRGRVLAILDIRELIGTPVAPLAASARVAVLSRDGVVVGIVTERVDGVVDLDAERLEPALLTLPASAAALVRGQVTEPAGPVAVLDVDAVFALRRHLPRVRRAG